MTVYPLLFRPYHEGFPGEKKRESLIILSSKPLYTESPVDLLPESSRARVKKSSQWINLDLLVRARDWGLLTTLRHSEGPSTAVIGLGTYSLAMTQARETLCKMLWGMGFISVSSEMPRQIPASVSPVLGKSFSFKEKISQRDWNPWVETFTVFSVQAYDSQLKKTRKREVSK